MSFSVASTLTLFFFSCHLCAIAQTTEQSDKTDCTNPTELFVSSDSIVINTSGNYKGFVSSSHPVIFYNEIDKYSFWYKFIFREDCKLVFSILPSDPEDLYNYFLYQHPGGNFCQRLILKEILPVRANLYKYNIKNKGTGLAETIVIDETDTSLNKRNLMFYTSHHNPVEAKKGDIYYLNVYHTKGEDCGHILYLDACHSERRIQALHKPCYVPDERETVPPVIGFIKELALEKNPVTAVLPEKPTEEKPLPVEVQKIVPEYIKLTGLIKDMKKGIPMNASVKIIDEQSGMSLTIDQSSGKGMYSVVVEKGKKYKQIFTAIGYKTNSIDFTAQRADSVMEILLQSVNAGENVVLNDIFFHPNTYVFRRESNNEMKSLLNFMTINDKAVIEIQGHTNGDYSIKPDKHFRHLGAEWNFKGTAKKLSKMRADIVKDYLTKHGIATDRITTTGYGGSKMLIPFPVSYEEGLQNMRVEILVVTI